jgi:hypothetical protein
MSKSPGEWENGAGAGSEKKSNQSTESAGLAGVECPDAEPKKSTGAAELLGPADGAAANGSVVSAGLAASPLDEGYGTDLCRFWRQFPSQMARTSPNN